LQSRRTFSAVAALEAKWYASVTVPVTVGPLIVRRAPPPSLAENFQAQQEQEQQQ
jgi:hypothetical protein